MKVAICIPTYSTWEPGFGISLTALVRYACKNKWNDRYLKLSCITEVGAPVPMARCGLATRAISEGADYLLFLDTDMTFPQDALHILLNAQKDIVAANYARRSFERQLLALEIIDGEGVAIESNGRHGLQRADGVGFGVALIKAHVFKTIPQPWFEIRWFENPSGPPFIGEDYLFCQHATRNGFEIWINHDLSQKVRHIGKAAFGIQGIGAP